MPIFSFDPHVPFILVHAQVKGPLRNHAAKMILDTGASYTMLAPEILLDIGYNFQKSEVLRPITTASGVEYVPFLKVIALEALGHQVEKLEVCAHSLPPNIPARGLLGLNFLRHFNVHLDFLKGKMEILGKGGTTN